ncbi:MAG: hypothetical protein QOE52_4763 [Mycobacterium sp.]|nr:hypothetical protein [Mycobacterium sp.]MDT5345579.1 hypothetical protein [Mycobacterium sp.]
MSVARRVIMTVEAIRDEDSGALVTAKRSTDYGRVRGLGVRVFADAACVMTLIQTLMSDDLVIQVSDRRLTEARTGTVVGSGDRQRDGPAATHR